MTDQFKIQHVARGGISLVKQGTLKDCVSRIKAPAPGESLIISAVEVEVVTPIMPEPLIAGVDDIPEDGPEPDPRPVPPHLQADPDASLLSRKATDGAAEQVETQPLLHEQETQTE